MKHGVSYMSGYVLQQWELISIDGDELKSYIMFKSKLLDYFWYIDRELTARNELS